MPDYLLSSYFPKGTYSRMEKNKKWRPRVNILLVTFNLQIHKKSLKKYTNFNKNRYFAEEDSNKLLANMLYTNQVQVTRSEYSNR